MALAIDQFMIAVVASFVTAGAAAGRTDDECRRLEMIRKSSLSSFEQLRGTELAADTWAGKELIAGFENCLVRSLSDGRTAYVCRGVLLDSEAAAKGELRDIAERMSLCPGGRMSGAGEAGVTVAFNDELPDAFVYRTLDVRRGKNFVDLPRLKEGWTVVFEIISPPTMMLP